MEKSFLVLLAIVLLETVTSEPGLKLSGVNKKATNDARKGENVQDVQQASESGAYHTHFPEEPVDDYLVGHGGTYYRKTKEVLDSLQKGYGVPGSHARPLGSLYEKHQGVLPGLVAKRIVPQYGEGNGVLNGLLLGKPVAPIYGEPVNPIYGEGHGVLDQLVTKPLSHLKVHDQLYGKPLNPLYGPGVLKQLSDKPIELLKGPEYGSYGHGIGLQQGNLYLNKALPLIAKPLYTHGQGVLNKIVESPVYGNGHGNLIGGNVINSIHVADGSHAFGYGPLRQLEKPIGHLHGNAYNPLFAPLDINPAKISLLPAQPLFNPINTVKVVPAKPLLTPIYEVKYPSIPREPLRTIVIHDKSHLNSGLGYAGYAGGYIGQPGPRFVNGGGILKTSIPGYFHGPDHVKVPAIPTFTYGAAHGKAAISISPSLSYGVSYTLVPESLHLHGPKYAPHHGHGVDKLDKAVAHEALRAAKTLIQGGEVHSHHHHGY